MREPWQVVMLTWTVDWEMVARLLLLLGTVGRGRMQSRGEWRKRRRRSRRGII